MQVEITEAMLKKGIQWALEEMSAGMTNGHEVGAVIGMRPDGSTTMLRGAQVTLFPVAPAPTLTVKKERPAFMRLVAENGRAVA